MNMPFDRLAYIDRLKEAGIEEPVARAHAQALREALEEGVATKADLEALEVRLGTRITDLKTELKSDIAELRAEMGEFQSGIRADIQRLDAKIDIVARDLVIKGAGGLVVLASLMIGLKVFS